MSKSSRRGFVTSTIAAGAAAIAAPNNGMANAAFQGGGKQKFQFAVEVGNIGNNTVEETIQYAKDLQITGISVPWNRVPGYTENGVMDAEGLKAIRVKIEQAGFVFHSMQASIPRTVLAGGAEADKQFGILRKNFDAMAAAKADLLMPFVPAPKTAPWDQIVGLYSRLMKDLEPCGIRIASHSYQALSSYAAISRLIKDVPSPNNGICFCTGNVWHAEGENIYNIPPDVASRFYYVHIRNVKTGLGEKEFYYDQGDINFPKLLAALRKSGYKGYYRSEHLPTDNYKVPRSSDVGTAWAQGYMRAMQEMGA